MKNTILALAGVVLATACSTTGPVREENRTLSYGCNDHVVIGRLANQDSYEHTPIEGDLIGHGWMQANLLVRRSVYGDHLSGEVPVRYFAHTFFRENRSFMFVLSKDNEGYKIETAQLMSVRPHAVSICN